MIFSLESHGHTGRSKRQVNGLTRLLIYTFSVFAFKSAFPELALVLVQVLQDIRVACTV